MLKITVLKISIIIYNWSRKKYYFPKYVEI